MRLFITGGLLILLGGPALAQTSVTDAGGNQYTGAFIKTDFTGEGKCIYPDGSLYSGGWKDGVYHGQGSYTGKDKVVYTGGWREGVAHGDGKLKLANGELFDGKWVQGDLVYASWFRADNSMAYTGDWKDHLYHGSGKQVIGNETYTGQFVQGKRSGKGELYVKYGKQQVLYKGDFSDGEIVAGQIIYPDGSYYEGKIRNYLPHDRNGKLVKKVKGQVVEQQQFFWEAGQRGLRGTRIYFSNDKEDERITGLWRGDSLLLGTGFYRTNKVAGSSLTTYGAYFPGMAVLEKASAGDAPSMFGMAVTATRHNDYRYALDWLEKCDNRRYAPARYLRGQLHYAGKYSLRKDTAYGNQLKRDCLPGLQTLAAANDAHAVVLLASYAMEQEQFDKSLVYAKQAASLNNTDGMIIMGLHYLYGWGLAASTATAVEWFKKGAAGGDGLAMYHLASISFGDGSNAGNEQNGLNWLRQSAEALYGNACEELGHYYAKNGQQAEALRYFRMGSWLNHLGASFEYAFLCQADGENKEHARRIIEYTAQYMHPKALHFLGNAYLNGYPPLGIVADNSKEPHSYFEMLAEEGDEQALLKLVELYREDNNVYTRNFKSNPKAIAWLQQGKERGYTWAMIQLADASYNGWLGMEKDRPAAFKLYLRAAEKGNISPVLVTCYQEGHGVKRDKNEAARWEAKYGEQQNKLKK